MPHFFSGQTKRRFGRTVHEYHRRSAGFSSASPAVRFSLSSLSPLSASSSSHSSKFFLSILLTSLMFLALTLASFAQEKLSTPCAKQLVYNISFKKDDLNFLPRWHNLAGIGDILSFLAASAGQQSSFKFVLIDGQQAQVSCQSAKGLKTIWQITEKSQHYGEVLWQVKKANAANLIFHRVLTTRDVDEVVARLTTDLAKQWSAKNKKFDPQQINKFVQQYQEQQQELNRPLLRPKQAFEISVGWDRLSPPKFSTYHLQALGFMEGLRHEYNYPIDPEIERAQKEYWDSLMGSNAAVHPYVWYRDPHYISFQEGLLSVELIPREGHPVYYFIENPLQDDKQLAIEISSKFGVPYAVKNLIVPQPYRFYDGQDKDGFYINTPFMEVLKQAYTQGATLAEQDQRLAANLVYPSTGEFKEQAASLAQAIQDYAAKANLKLRDLEVYRREQGEGGNAISFTLALNKPHPDFNFVEQVMIRLGPEWLLDYKSHYMIEKENRMLLGRYDEEEADKEYVVERAFVYYDNAHVTHFKRKAIKIRPQVFYDLGSTVRYLEGLLGNYVQANAEEI